MKRALLGLLLCLAAPGAAAQTNPATPPSPGLEQLRSAIGLWDVRTQFLNPDGSIAGAFDGVYEFEWVVADRVVQGVSRIPALEQVSAILFYLRPASSEIEMVSVGRDGQLWVMTGRDGEEVRTTPDVQTADGGVMRLRFTRFNVASDRFESRMEISTDRGATWRRGNHQLFRRRSAVDGG